MAVAGNEVALAAFGSIRVERSGEGGRTLREWCGPIARDSGLASIVAADPRSPSVDSAASSWVKQKSRPAKRDGSFVKR
jgi:hypothetical protein